MRGEKNVESFEKHKSIEINMPYGKVKISTPEEAARFIKNKCNDCEYIHTCSGNRSSRCESKLESVIETFFSNNQ